MDRVIVYEQPNHQGRPHELHPGRWDTAQLAVGNIRSLRVPAGWIVTLFGFQGRTKTFTQDTPDVGVDFNGLTSSIHVSITSHEALYRSIRASILARHFALGRYWRTNHFRRENRLGSWLSTWLPRQLGDTNRQGLQSFGCSAKNWGRPQKTELTNPLHPVEIYSNASALRDSPESQIERWRVKQHWDSNPLAEAGAGLTRLCVEHLMGHPTAPKIVEIVLATLDSLFKLKDTGTPFEGYILRWDPATTDSWTVTIDHHRKETPQICCEFLLNPDTKTFRGNHYLYCTPLNDPLYRANDPARFRMWEPSMDEYIALLAGYFMVWFVFSHNRVSASTRILASVKEQVRRVGSYLQSVGYLLVRPCGGFTVYGAAGVNPCMEYPFSRLFKLITGEAFAVTATFADAINKAGLSLCWNRSPSQLISDSINVLRQNQALDAIQEFFGDDPIRFLTQLFGDDGALAETTIAEAAQTSLRLDCIELRYKSDRKEFVLARIMKNICKNPRKGFEFYMKSVLSRDASSEAFKPLIALTALPNLAGGDDPEGQVVRDAYLSWYDAKLAKYPNKLSPLATAVAVLLRPTDPQLEFRLASQLKDMRDTLITEQNSDLMLKDKNNGDPPPFTFETAGEGVYPDLPPSGDGAHYTTSLALAWLYQTRVGGRVAFRDLPLPDPARITSWPVPSVPKEVIAAALAGPFPVPLDALIEGWPPNQLTGHEDVDLFKDPPPKHSDNDCGNAPPPQPPESHKVTVNDLHPFAATQYDKWAVPALQGSEEKFDLRLVGVETQRQDGVAEVLSYREGSQYVVKVTFKRDPRQNHPFTGNYTAIYTLAWAAKQ